MSSIILYGIKNCDSVKKSCKWLDNNCIRYCFHDFHKHGITKSIINEFLKNIEIERLINKRSTTWKKLSEKEKKCLFKPKIIELLLKNPTLIKRPVIKTKNKFLVGFDQKKFEELI